MTRSDWLPIAILGGFVVLADAVIVVVELTSSGPSSSSWLSSSSEPPHGSSEPVLSPREVRAARADAGVSPNRPLRTPGALQSGPSPVAPRRPLRPSGADSDHPEGAASAPETR